MKHQEGQMAYHQAVDERQAAAILGKAVQTLRNDRHRRRGVPYVKMGRSVRYLMADLMDYLQKHRINPGAG